MKPKATSLPSIGNLLVPFSCALATVADGGAGVVVSCEAYDPRNEIFPP